MAPIPSFYASCSAPYPFGARPQLRSSLDASDPFTEELFKEDTGFLSLKGLPTDHRVKALTFFSNQRKKSPSIRALSHLLSMNFFSPFLCCVLNLNSVYEYSNPLNLS